MNVGNRKVFMSTGAITQTVSICTERNQRGRYEQVLRLPRESVSAAEVGSFLTINDLTDWLLLDRGATDEGPRQCPAHTDSPELRVAAAADGEPGFDGDASWQPGQWLDDRQRKELWTWRLVAALTARFVPAFVIETHPGDGMYDQVVVGLPDDRPAAPEDLAQVQMNRLGRLHAGRGGRDTCFDVWSELDAGLDVSGLLDSVLRATGGPVPPAPPAASAVTAGFSAMAELIEATIEAQAGRWEWRNGYLDTSGSDGGARRELFAVFPYARDDCRPGEADLYGRPEYRFWFLLHDGAPVIAAQPAAALLYLPDTRVPIEAPDAVDQVTAALFPQTRPTAASDDGTGSRPSRFVWQPGDIQIVAPPVVAPDARAKRLAEAIAGPVDPYTPGQPLPGRAAWFTDRNGDRLVVVADQDAPQPAVNKAFAYALAWQHDRDLALVLPTDRAADVLYRLPWITTPVRVWTTDANTDTDPRPAVVPTRDEVLTVARKWPVHGQAEHDLGARRLLVAALADAADEHWALTPAHQPAYLAWHCAGHKVLELQRAGSNAVRITAGVNFGNPADDQPPAHCEKVTVALTSGQRARIEAKIAATIDACLNSSRDYTNIEHRMQAALAAAGMPGLSLAGRPAREYPAWRPARLPHMGHGFIDFLAIDTHNRIHVVETKVGSDGMLVLQVLDYLIWVTAHTEQIRAEHRWPAPAKEFPIEIDLVLAPKGNSPAIGPYTAGQLEVLAGDIRCNLFLVADPRTEIPAVSALPRSAVHDPTPGIVAAPVQPPRFTGRVQRQLHQTTAGGGRFHADPEAALLPAARAAYADLAAAGLLHKYALHARSSQAFALNLFAPLDPDGRQSLLRSLGLNAATTEPAIFEYTDAADRLAEAKPGSPHRTQVDVLLRGTDNTGARLAALIEVKFTETDFSDCSAYTNPNNPHRDVCRTPGLFGSDPDRCYQLSNHGTGRRYYDIHLADQPLNRPEQAHDGGGCLVRRGLNQPMRNLALAHVMVDGGDADKVVYALCAPARHCAIWRRFAEARAAFPDTPTRTLATLTAEQVAAIHPDGGTALAAHYPISELGWPVAPS